MSENINNREYRKKVIKDIIKQLHDGKELEEVKEDFAKAFEGVSAAEITEAENALIAEGLPVSEVQRLCDVHASVFKGSIEDIHKPNDESEIPGHPANILIRENKVIETFIEEDIKPLIKKLFKEEFLLKFKSKMEELIELVDLHYVKKENLLFPFMEKYGITAPPQVMWGVDDEIRQEIKSIVKYLDKKDIDVEELKENSNSVSEKIIEMIFKEENIMLPMLLENLTQDEWKTVYEESDELGYIVKNIPVWNPDTKIEGKQEEKKPVEGMINLSTGMLKLEEFEAMMNVLPLDITFVDKNDFVKYFSEGERTFPRTKAIIGRKVSNCHPPSSVHIVEKIVEDFKSGKKDNEDFWIKMDDKYILIRYFAVRNVDGEYLGAVELTQNIRPMQEITGEKRLMTE
ncbi:MAG: DUF438 domain-containing protein [Bacillota bacterium]|nr:DUF438 domain-containing protein [Bacillota bacterium]